MGAVGTSADNALAESFNAALKREVLRDRKVFDNLEADHQRVSLSKIFRGLAQDVAFFAQLRDFLFELADSLGISRLLGVVPHEGHARQRQGDD